MFKLFDYFEQTCGSRKALRSAMRRDLKAGRNVVAIIEVRESFALLDFFVVYVSWLQITRQFRETAGRRCLISCRTSTRSSKPSGF